jgi:hypothetical protein
MDRILDAIARAPMAAKAGVVAAILVVLTVLNYFVISVPTFGPSISETEQRIARTDVEQKRLDNDLIEKTAIANNLNQFRRSSSSSGCRRRWPSCPRRRRSTSSSSSSRSGPARPASRSRPSSPWPT